jgi:hypothetical protein
LIYEPMLLAPLSHAQALQTEYGSSAAKATDREWNTVWQVPVGDTREVQYYTWTMDLGRQYETTGVAVTYAWEPQTYWIESSAGPDCTHDADPRSWKKYNGRDQDYGGIEGRSYLGGNRIVQEKK